ncbi:MAG: lipid-A-disaccharide synthase [Acidobacteriaceae bacterium]|nr:lipid-A-disaccharide synthase [Acidobacteriaceae bacterium]MBV9499586.1 lipid-A-disaccharide synthase [Acidobacteriaceae bacterium]
MQFLVSAGEASGDMYAAGIVRRLQETFPSAEFYGCAGPHLRDAGVQPVIDSARLAVVGLAEVVAHLPRIYSEYRRLIGYIRRNRPGAAILSDSPDFHLRVARHLKRLGVPVFYVVAPQVWAWRQGRVRVIRDVVTKLFCLFPFEEDWFRHRGVDAIYIGHPLLSMVRVQTSRENFFDRYQLPKETQVLVLLPGSRIGEARRHMPVLLDTVAHLRKRFALSVLLAVPKGFRTHEGFVNFREPINALSIKVVENQTWDCIGHANLALAASGTVTIEAAVLGTPMITFYKVNPLTWWAGRHLVKVPFLSMVNLVAQRQIVPELIQYDMTAERMAQEAEQLLAYPEKADLMRADLALVRAALTCQGDPLQHAADVIAEACSVRAGSVIPHVDILRETIG